MIMRPRGSPIDLERRRCEALRLLAEGRTQAQAARAVGASPSSVVRWRRLAAGVPEAAVPRPHPGRPPRLAPDQIGLLDVLLRGGATAQGFPDDAWKVSRVRDVIRSRFGVDFHAGHVRKILARHVGWGRDMPAFPAPDAGPEPPPPRPEPAEPEALPPLAGGLPPALGIPHASAWEDLGHPAGPLDRALHLACS